MASQICNSCGKQRASVTGRESALIHGNFNYLCDSCSNAGFEPRHVIVIVGRSKGIEAVKEFVVNHKYVGDDITGVELIK